MTDLPSSVTSSLSEAEEGGTESDAAEEDSDGGDEAEEEGRPEKSS